MFWNVGKGKSGTGAPEFWLVTKKKANKSSALLKLLSEKMTMLLLEDPEVGWHSL